MAKKKTSKKEAAELAAIHRNVLEGLMNEFYSGKRIQLFHAIFYCGRYGVPLPEWATVEVEQAFHSYNRAEKETLGEAFGIERKKRSKFPAEQDRAKKAWRVYQEVVRRNEGGQGLGPELYELVGRGFNISGRTARRYHEDVRKTLSPEKQHSTP